MPRPAQPPDHRLGPIRWTWRPYARGVPAEHAARAWLSTLGADAAAPGDAEPLRRNAHGRPILASPDARHDASWSHSGEWLLVALGDGVDVGVDLEWIKPRERALELAERYFTTDETRWLTKQPASARDEAFVRLWCAKEAVLKAHGRGLAFGLHKLAFAEREGALALVAAAPELGAPNTWTLHECAPLPGYRAALAWREHG